MAGEKKVSFRLTEETKAWLREVGGGGDRGALQAGFDALVEFAQTLPVSFERFVNIGVYPDKPFGIKREIIQKMEVPQCAKND